MKQILSNLCLIFLAITCPLSIYSQDKLTTKYYSNGNIKAIGVEIEGMREGEWKYYFFNDTISDLKLKKILKIGKYKNDNQIANWKTYDIKGILIEILNYKKNSTKGSMSYNHKTFYPSGALKEDYEVLNNHKTGNYTSYYSDKTIKEKGYYKDNNKTGEWQSYNPNNKGRSITYFHQGKKHGKHLSFKSEKDTVTHGSYNLGKKIGIWTHFKNGKINTSIEYLTSKNYIHKSYYENGKLDLVLNYSDGRQQGEQLRYHDNGQLQTVSYYNNGKASNKWKVFNRTGVLILERLFDDNGKLTDENTFFIDGTIKTIKNDFLYEERFQNGVIKKKCKYNNENKHCKEYFDNQTIKKEEKYVGDKLILLTKYYSNGKIKAKCKDNSNGSTVCEIYYRSGKIERIESRKNGNAKPNGIWSYYKENGELLKEVNFDKPK